MTSVGFINWDERKTGANHPAAAAVGNAARPDVINRPLRNVLSLSGYNPDAAVFTGLAGPVFNAIAYGADPTGANDSTAAVTLADVAAAAAGGVVHFPQGTYQLGPMTVTAREWYGAGRSATTITHKANGAAGEAMLTFAFTFRMHDLTIDGNYTNQPNRTRTLLHTGGFNAVVSLERVRFQNTSINALKIGSVTGTVAVRECEFLDQGPSTGSAANQEAVAIYGNALSSGRLIVEGCRFINGTPVDPTLNVSAIQVQGAGTTSLFSLLVRNNYFENQGYQNGSQFFGAVHVYNTASQVDVSHNTFRTPHYDAINVADAHAIIIHGNTVSDITTGFTGACIFASLNARSLSATWSSASIIGNIVRNATAHRGNAYDFTTDQSPSAGGPWVIANNIADQVYGGMRLYGLVDAALTGNVVRGATAATEVFPSLMLEQCAGVINIVGGEIGGGASVGVRVQDVLTALRLSINAVAFKSNTTAHIKVDDTVGSTTLAYLGVRGCEFTGSITPLSVNRATLVVLRGNQSDLVTRTFTSVTTVVDRHNSWNDLAGVSADRGDASPTLAVATDSAVQRFATNLTANRTVTLSATNAVNGSRFRVVRTGLGAFTLDVGGLKTIPSATAAWVDVAHDGTAWRLAGYGTL